ncbi:MAG TPA: hypothetical protein VKB88_24915 [Bryobacteraceae bacterium]|nr:hypothetical protein [Bryobacteraceae bacterium]
MASPPIPPALGHLANRPFSFYPAIRGIEHNEWLFRKATWSDMLVVNRKTGEELLIPRRLVGEVSIVDDPVVIVGLLRDLEYREGAVWPCQRHVIEMPIAVGEARQAAAQPRPVPAPVVAIRLEPRKTRRIYKVVGCLMALAILLHLAISLFTGRTRSPIPLRPAVQR